MISNGQDANATNFNNAFLSRSANTSASGIVSFLNNTESIDILTGAVIVSGGVAIAKNLNVGGTIKATAYKDSVKTYAEEPIPAGGVISKDDTHNDQVRRVSGDGLAITTANAPFGDCTNMEDGVKITLVGYSDAESVTIPALAVGSVPQFGIVQNGKAVLTQYRKIQYQYDKTLERFIENWRNF